MLRHKNSTQMSAFLFWRKRFNGIKCRGQQRCRTLRCTLRFVSTLTRSAVGRISSSPPQKCNPTRPIGLLFSFHSNRAGTSLREKGKIKHAQHGRIALGGRRPAEQ